MARPPRLKPLTATHRVCGWVNGRGHTRGLYAQQRGQFVQGRISGYSMKPRYLLAPDWITLGYDVQNIVLHWSPTWRLQGIKLRSPDYGNQSLLRNPRHILEVRAHL